MELRTPNYNRRHVCQIPHTVKAFACRNEQDAFATIFRLSSPHFPFRSLALGFAAREVFGGGLRRAAGFAATLVSKAFSRSSNSRTCWGSSGSLRRRPHCRV